MNSLDVYKSLLDVWEETSAIQNSIIALLKKKHSAIRQSRLDSLYSKRDKLGTVIMELEKALDESYGK